MVVSSGAIGSPVVLQRSGIGEAERLSKLGIKVVSDVPAGSTYEDHNLILFPFHVPDDTETIDPILNQEPGVMESLLPKFAAGGKGWLASNFLDSGAKLRPTPEELEELGPEFGKYWDSYFKNAPDKVGGFDWFVLLCLTKESSPSCSWPLSMASLGRWINNLICPGYLHPAQ